MKARVKATGEIFEIASYATIQMECCDSFGSPLRFSFDEVEILSEEIENNCHDYWDRLKHQYAGMAMQGILSNDNLYRSIEDEVRFAIQLANALVKKLKEEEKK